IMGAGLDKMTDGMFLGGARRQEMQRIARRQKLRDAYICDTHAFARRNALRLYGADFMGQLFLRIQPGIADG
ncbi:MAG: hypothetical protein ABI729_06850, partial [Chitinophagales bacterium]